MGTPRLQIRPSNPDFLDLPTVASLLDGGFDHFAPLKGPSCPTPPPDAAPAAAPT